MPPLAHYKLNNDANDAGGNGLHGTPTNVSYVAGKVRQAAGFNGTSSKVTRAAIPQLALNVPWTVCFWVNIAAATGSYQFLFSHVIDANNVIAIFYLYTIRAGVYDGVDRTQVPTNAAVNLGTWYHVAMTWDGVSTVKLYLNGVEQSGSASGTAYGATAGLFIGCRDNSSRWVNGLMDDVRIYDGALPTGEIKAIYNFGRGSEECEPWQRLIRPIARKMVQPLMGV